MNLQWLFWLLFVVVIAGGLFLAFRWWLGRKQQQVIEEANSNLRLPIPESSLTRRSTMIDRVLSDPELLREIEATAASKDLSQEEVTETARRYALEIGPSFNAFFYFKLGYWLARTLIRLHYRIRTVSVDESALNGIAPGATVILVSNHRSSLDPLILTYLASNRSTVALSAGEWARLWPLHHLVRAAGGYIVDRDSADPLYKKVLGCYVRTAAESGIHHVVYPEGKLTQDGRMQQPSLGFLNFFCRALGDNRDIVFIPVGINYDRIPEDRNLAAAHRDFTNPGKLYLIGSSLRYAGQVLRLPFTRREHRFGYACAAFGSPVSLLDWLRQHKINTDELVTTQRYGWLPQLAEELMARCGRKIPATPVAVVATVLCAAPARAEWTVGDLQNAAERLVEELTASEAHVYMSDHPDTAIELALKLLVHHKFVKRLAGNRYTIIEAELPVLQYYANTIAHLTE